MMPSWGMSPGSWKDQHPIGWDAEQFIMDNPQWVLYLRRDRRFVCPEHKSAAAGSPVHLEEPCTRCFGTGVKIDAQIVPCRLTFKEPNVSHRETEFRTAGGWLEYYTAAADFPRSIMPQNEDFVLVCEWDKPTQRLGEYPRARVMKIQNVYVIKQVNDYFERELSHVGCGLEAQVQDLLELQRHVPFLQDVQIINPRKPGRGQSRWSRESYW